MKDKKMDIEYIEKKTITEPTINDLISDLTTKEIIELLKIWTSLASSLNKGMCISGKKYKFEINHKLIGLLRDIDDIRIVFKNYNQTAINKVSFNPCEYSTKISESLKNFLVVNGSTILGILIYIAIFK